MDYSPHDDFVIQATQLFNDSVASEGIVSKYALVLENANHKENGQPKECTKSFVNTSSQVHHMTRAAVFLAAEFQEALDDYHKHISKQKSKKTKKGFKDI